MRDILLRWGMGMGVLAAAVGTGALLLGALIEPIKQVTSADTLALAFFVRGMLVLISLGVALGLAYYAGVRVARAYFQSLIASADSAETATNTAIASLAGMPVNRRYTVLAGGLTMFCYWLITSMYIFVLPPADQSSAPRTDILSFVETRLLFGFIYVVFGLGLGGLGGRVPAARLLLDRIALAKPALTTPLATPVATAAPVPAPETPTPSMAPEPGPSSLAEPVSIAPLDELDPTTADAGADHGM